MFLLLCYLFFVYFFIVFFSYQSITFLAKYNFYFGLKKYINLSSSPFALKSTNRFDIMNSKNIISFFYLILDPPLNFFLFIFNFGYYFVFFWIFLKKAYFSMFLCFLFIYLINKY